MGGGEFGTPVGLPTATARVDSRLKLTFGQLVSKSTHHVWQVDYLGAVLGWGYGEELTVFWISVKNWLVLATKNLYNCWMKNKLVVHNQKYRR